MSLNIKNDTVVREIEKNIDEYPLSLPFFEEPSSYCLWNLMVAHEHMIESPSLITQFGLRNISVLLDRSKFALMYSFGWVDKSSQDYTVFSPPALLNRGRLRQALEILLLAFEYEGVVVAYTYYSRGVADAVPLDKRTIRFSFQEREFCYDFLDKWLFLGQFKDTQPGSQLTISDTSKYSNIFKRIYNRSFYRSREWLDVVWQDGELIQILPFARIAMESSFHFPDDWSFRGISIDTFRKLWETVTALCQIHSICHSFSLHKDDLENGIASIVLVNTKEWWLDLLMRIQADIDGGDIEAAVDLLTYDPSLSKPDPSLQPFIPLGENWIAVAPRFYLSCNHERNLMAFLAKNFSDEYNSTTSSLEETMLSDLVKVFCDFGFDVASRKRFRPGLRLPDLDIAIFERSTSFLLIIEAKWVIAAADVGEKFERAKREKEGIEQVRKLLHFVRNNLDSFWNVCFQKVPKPQRIEIAGCVAMRGFTGTSFNEDSLIPVVEESILKKQIRELCHIDELYAYMRDRSFLPVLGQDFSVSEATCDIGPFKVYAPAMKMGDASKFVRIM